MNATLFARNGLSTIKGSVLHLGAHEAEEIAFYREHGNPTVAWVEANPDKWPIIRAKMPVGHYLVEAAVSDEVGTAKFWKYSHSDNNSFFLPGKGMPAADVVFPVGAIDVKTLTVDSLLNIITILRECSLLSMDVQGAELKALRGAREFLSLPSLTHIYTEVIHVEQYVGQVTEQQYYDFLKDFGFIKIDSDAEGGREWGNLLFARK